MVTICLRRRLPGASSDRYPRTEASRLERPPIWPCSGRGLPGRPVTRPPVGSYPTFSPLPDSASPETTAAGGNFLWHFPSGRPDWVLPSALLCGARTFLQPRYSLSRRSPVRLDPPSSLPRCLRFLDVSIDRLVGEGVGSIVVLPGHVLDLHLGEPVEQRFRLHVKSLQPGLLDLPAAVDLLHHQL